MFSIAFYALLLFINTLSIADEKQMLIERYPNNEECQWILNVNFQSRIVIEELINVEETFDNIKSLNFFSVSRVICEGNYCFKVNISIVSI